MLGVQWFFSRKTALYKNVHDDPNFLSLHPLLGYSKSKPCVTERCKLAKLRYRDDALVIAETVGTVHWLFHKRAELCGVSL